MMRWVYRYSASVRAGHWINAVSIGILLMSGLQIFNAHPALYWGEDSDFERPIFSIYNAFTPEGRPMGVTRIFGRSFETTGLLGRSEFHGRPVQRAFPSWITIPAAQDLATGRVWHFFFAWVFVVNGAVYAAHSLASRHLSRDLLPRRDELKRVGGTVRAHLPWKPRRDAARPEYNVVQKLVYLGVLLGLTPLVILTGLTMSPAINAAAPWLLDVFGGRQAARTVHFVVTWLWALFVLLHVLMVAATGFLNNVRSMITGWYAADGKEAHP